MGIANKGRWIIEWGSLVFLLYALYTFLMELWLTQQRLNRIWLTLTIEQRAMENVVLGLMDIKLMLAVLCLIAFYYITNKRK